MTWTHLRWIKGKGVGKCRRHFSTHSPGNCPDASSLQHAPPPISMQGPILLSRQGEGVCARASEAVRLKQMPTTWQHAQQRANQGNSTACELQVLQLAQRCLTTCSAFCSSFLSLLPRQAPQHAMNLDLLMALPRCAAATKPSYRAAREPPTRDWKPAVCNLPLGPRAAQCALKALNAPDASQQLRLYRVSGKNHVWEKQGTVRLDALIEERNSYWSAVA